MGCRTASIFPYHDPDAPFPNRLECVFIGDVVAKNETSRLTCDRLQINFMDLSPAEIKRNKETARPGRFQLVERLLLRRSASKHGGASADERLRRRFTKKPISAVATGNVVVLSSVHDKEAPTRLLSRLRIAGPQLNIDLLRDQLDVTLEDNQLSIRGKQVDEPEREFLHRGIAARQFQRTFVLADGMEVSGAAMENGLLVIDLARPEPERVVRTIEIRDNS